MSVRVCVCVCACGFVRLGVCVWVCVSVSGVPLLYYTDWWKDKLKV